MRLRTFTGANMTEAMAAVRRELGADAVIIHTATAADGGVEIRAAAERAEVAASTETAEAAVARRDKERARARGDAADGLTRIARALSWHNPPERAAEALMDAAVNLEDGEATATLARAIDARYAVHPVEPDPGRPLLFAGPPGAGKSSVVGKLAARCVAQGLAPVIVGADRGAGAREQLSAYAAAMEVRFEDADGPRELEALVRDLPAGPVLIDAPGINPFELDDLDDLQALAASADAEIVAVMDAGQAPGDAEDAAALLASIGAGRVIATKLDSARRLGALLGFGEAGLAYAQIAASPYIGGGLAPATPLRLARALLDDFAMDPDQETRQ
ncbi:flagellar biosynthesis-like protein (FlhF) [Marinicauda salina]|uniref:Flagellar biosynthesis-like protein (FlhF) n=1 Tax=Marinicauda salina TaxID=2135793 RepID=A0A2U2BRX7_9PROT|nr:flagellar biosynthesis-like protein (FlhF) [Marinicauda salina]PWE16774.1 flagellar biosynthesis-like protein (FlhF) [Marinicauda salina]